LTVAQILRVIFPGITLAILLIIFNWSVMSFGLILLTFLLATGLMFIGLLAEQNRE